MARIGRIYDKGIFNKHTGLLGRCFPWYVNYANYFEVCNDISFLGTDACAVPVLTPKEAGKVTSDIPIFHPQVSNQLKVPGQYSDPKSVIIQPGLHTDAVLRDFGFDTERIRQLKDEGVLGKHVSSKL